MIKDLILKKSVYFIFLCFAFLPVYAQNDQPDSSQVDAWTSATKKVYDSIDQADTNYKVIGKIDGVNGYVVRYDPLLYRGGEIVNRKGMSNLSRMGIKTIISLSTTDLERRLARQYNIALVEMDFGYELLPKEQVEFFRKVVREKDGPFYVHCHGGTHRAGILGSIYRIDKQGWACERALVEFHRLGGPDNSKLKPQVESYFRDTLKLEKPDLDN